MKTVIERNPAPGAVSPLFREYAASLSFELDFQDFDGEARRSARPYAPPTGALLLARVEGEPAGCAALRELDVETVELKRLFVRGSHRGFGLGRRLAEAAIEVAAELGYRRIRLDTTPEMAAAQALYPRWASARSSRTGTTRSRGRATSSSSCPSADARGTCVPSPGFRTSSSSTTRASGSSHCRRKPIRSHRPGRPSAAPTTRRPSSRGHSQRCFRARP